MYKPNDYIKLNQYDENQVIWRYMNFEKFISLLQNKALFFSTCFNMQKLDPFEGYYTKINLDELKDEKGNNIRYNQHAKGKPQEYRKIFLKNTFINCWHLNDNENSAMWNIYAPGTNGLVIKSTIKCLEKSFKNKNNEEYIGNIEYKDYYLSCIKFDAKKYVEDITRLAEQQVNINTDKAIILTELKKYYYPLIMSKRKEYKFENEIRVVSPFIHNNDKNCIKDYGKFIKVDLETLISEIIISPCADGWYVDLIKDVSRKYNLKCKIYKSKLYEKFDN